VERKWIAMKWTRWVEEFKDVLERRNPVSGNKLDSVGRINGQCS
jgi:hypothetical protein